MDLHPRLDQALLRSREAAFTGFEEHSNNDAEESRELGHEPNLTSSGFGLSGNVGAQPRRAGFFAPSAAAP